MIVLSRDSAQRTAVYVFFAACLAKSAFEAERTYVEHNENNGGSWRHAFDLVAHWQSIVLAASGCVGAVTGIYRATRTRSTLNRVQPAMDPAVVVAENTTKRTSVSVDETEQWEAYEALVASAKFDDVAADEMIEAAVKQWRRIAKGPRKYSEEAAAIMSEACRGRIAPAVCVRMLHDATRKDQYILRRHEETLIKLFSATYLRVQRLAEEKEFYRDVLYGPADGSGVQAFKWHLRL